MSRAPRKTSKPSLKSRLKARLTKSLRAARTATPAQQAAASPLAPRASTPKRATPALVTTARIPRLPPSKRGPRTSARLTSARPTIGAPPLVRMAPSIAPPLIETTPAPAAATSLQPAAGTGGHLPPRYGSTQLVLLVRDPWWLYAYWEVTPARAAEVQRRMTPEERAQHATILRLYDVTDRAADAARAHRWMDVVLTHDVDNWFVDTGEANRTWVAELGYRTAHGRFYPLVRSNVVTTPRAGPSDQFDEAWMTTDDAYWKLLGVVYGLGFGTSSFEIRQLLERRFRDVVSSARSSRDVPASGGGFTAPRGAR